MKDFEKHYELENFIRNYVPDGWKEPLHKVMFCPMVYEDNYDKFKNGIFPDNMYEVIKIAIKEYFNGHS